MKGTIFDIKRFAVHDGPGLRTTLFFKGCPLRCPWCQNPEGLDSRTELWHFPTNCLHCGTCVASCEAGALSIVLGSVNVNHMTCTLCGQCSDACPTDSLRMQGRELTTDEAVDLLLRDRDFYGEDGGITLSGGEVLLQWQFALEILERCHEQGINTAIETSLFAKPEVIEAFPGIVDHFYVDLKILDNQNHKRYIGVDNAVILSNFERLVHAGCHVIARTPLIPGYTATEENIRDIAAYIHSIDPDIPYELLNYNPLCKGKYAANKVRYPVEGEPFTADAMNAFYQIPVEQGLTHVVKE